MESSDEPLAHPMVNLIVIGSMTNLKIISKLVGKDVMIKDAYRLVPYENDEKKQVEKHSSLIDLIRIMKIYLLYFHVCSWLVIAGIKPWVK